MADGTSVKMKEKNVKKNLQISPGFNKIEIVWHLCLHEFVGTKVTCRYPDPCAIHTLANSVIGYN